MRLAVFGAGIAGLTLTGRLHNVLGWEVVVLEKAPQPRSEGRVIRLVGPGYGAAEAMGVLPWPEELSRPVPGMVLVGERGQCRAELAYDRLARPVNGRLLSTMRPDLELALRERLLLEVRLRFGAGPAPIGVRPYGVRVTLTDGTHSTVRALVFGEEPQYVRHLGDHAAGGTFDDPETRAAIGDRYCLTDTVGRQMSLYPLRDGRVAVSAVHRAPRARLPRDARAALRREFGTLGRLVPRVLAKCPPPERIYDDVVAQADLPCWSRGRVVLVGDVCQAVSPLAGQGASLPIGGLCPGRPARPRRKGRGRTARLRTTLAARRHTQTACRPAGRQVVGTRIAAGPAGPPRRPAAVRPARHAPARRHPARREPTSSPAPTRHGPGLGE